MHTNCPTAQYNRNPDIRHLKLKDAVAGTVPWKTFTSILDFYVQCTDGWLDNKVTEHC